MNPNTHPIPQHEAPQYAPDPHNPHEAEIAEFYAQVPAAHGLATEQQHDVPRTLTPQETGQFTAPLQEKPEAPQYALPAGSKQAEFYATTSKPEWRGTNAAGDYVLQPSQQKPEQVAQPQTLDERRFGLRSLMRRLRRH